MTGGNAPRTQGPHNPRSERDGSWRHGGKHDKTDTRINRASQQPLLLAPPLDWRVELQEGLRTRAAVTCRNIMLDAILYLEKLATCRYIMWEAVLCVEKL